MLSLRKEDIGFEKVAPTDAKLTMKSDLQFIHHGGYRVAVLPGNPQARGTPLVFLHGIAGSVDFWPALLPPNLKQRRRWYSIGLPGHYPGAFSTTAGFSSEVTPELFAEILSVVLRRLFSSQPVALIGYSTGGFAALNLAAREPKLVESVFSISGFSVGKWHGILGLLQKLAGLGHLGSRASATLWSLITSNPALFRKLLLSTAQQLEAHSFTRDSLIGIVEHDARQQNPVVLSELVARIRQFDIRPMLGAIRVPTLIAAGDCDPIVSYQHTRELASAISNAELVTFHGVGHLFFVECLDEYQRLLEDWIDRRCEPNQLRYAA